MKALLLDWDGTLYDSTKFWDDLPYLYLHSKQIQPEEGLSAILESMTLDESVIYLRSHYDCTITKSDLVCFMEQTYMHSISWIEGAKNLLKKAYNQNISVFIVTIGEKELIQKILQDANLAYVVQDIVSGSKNTLKMYDKILEKYSYQKEDCLVMDDNEDVVELLHENGWMVQQYKDGIKIDDFFKNYL